MASRSGAFWTFILILVLLHLVLRLALGLTLIPDLLVVALLIGARRLDGPGAALFGLALGVVADSLAMVAFGATAVAFVVVAYIGSRSRNVFEGDSYLFIAAYALVGAWLAEAIRYAVGGFYGRGLPPVYLVSDALIDAAYVMIATVISLIAFRAISGRS